MFNKENLKQSLSDNNLSNSFYKDAFLRFKRNKMAVSSMFILLVIILLSIISPFIIPYSYDYIDWSVSFPSSPNWSQGHILGTDGNGRDLFARLMLGVRISITIGLLAAIVSVIIGTIWGSVSAYIGGKTDLIMMRIVDILYSIPFMFLVILFVLVFGQHVYLMFISIGSVTWLTMSRIVRGQTISIKNREYIEAAKSYSLSSFLIIFRHIIPNLLSTVVIYATLTIPQVILIESFISFLGLGIQEPSTSLGLLIAEGARVMEEYPWMFFAPVVFLTIILFCFNFIGDGLRDALDHTSK